MEAYFNVAKHVDRFGLEPILRLPELIFSNLVREFYADVVDKKNYSGTSLNLMWCARLALDRGKIALALGCWNEGLDMDLKKGLYETLRWNMGEVVANLEPLVDHVDRIERWHSLLVCLSHFTLFYSTCSLIMWSLKRVERMSWGGAICISWMWCSMVTLKPSIAFSFPILSLATCKQRHGPKVKDICYGFSNLLSLIF